MLFTMKGYCNTCGEETLWVARPIYEGFRKASERFICSECGKEQKPESTALAHAGAPGAIRTLPSIFDESDRLEEIRLKDDGEGHRICRHCRHYLVNAFTQRCALTLQEVNATDGCDRFEKRDTGSQVV